ncbi:MAG: transposase [Eubacteriaceae bacterium]|nr:transposase [Eubacteriaceae bacterium]
MLAQNSDIKEYQTCCNTFIKWADEITESFDHDITNGYTEGVNNKIKVLKRVSFRVRNFTRFRNRILHMMA